MSIQELIQKNKSDAAENISNLISEWFKTHYDFDDKSELVSQITDKHTQSLKDLIDAVIEDDDKDWTIDTDDQNRNFISYKDGRRELIGDDWGIICFLHKKMKDTMGRLQAIKELL